ncbi:DUF11 domain-containing protein [Dysgonomonas sp. 521]|uniref:Ig-like domain-containing protein n=1 Tax=Dysgonomonas sp. 521 TaxID=2302932 RepID=UPI001C86B7C4|nr:Ig-like domain-containing protein [Dysgonomonas sp. 521]NDV95662.1 DUF11 domain-containing protein [Dysgonomonas sp. 521]
MKCNTPIINSGRFGSINSFGENRPCTSSFTNKIIRSLFLCLLFFNIFTVTHAALKVNMHNSSLKSGSTYTFPNLTVSGDALDKGYVIKIKYSGVISAGDEITLPSLPGGWSELSGGTLQEYTILINTGATAADIQSFLRLVEFTVGSDRAGQEISIWIGHDSNNSSRSLNYNPDNGHWYELSNDGLSWADAYNAALRKSFSGLQGYLVTVTSAEEQAFITSFTNNEKSYWIGATRLDIRDVQDPVTGLLASAPTASLDYWYWTAGPEWNDHGRDPEQSVFYNKKAVNSSTEYPPLIPNYTYTNWLDGEPNDWPGANEDCAYVDPGKNIPDSWSDYTGTASKPYLVEYNGTMQGASSEGVIIGASILNASVGGIVDNGLSETTPVWLHDGDILTYTITAANLSATSSSVVVRDTVPAGLTVDVASVASSGGVYTEATREIVWNLTIAPGTDTSVSFNVTKTAGATNLMTNTAYVTSGGITKKTNSTYHAGEPKLSRISYQYMACPDGGKSEITLGFYEQEGVSYKWYDASGGTSISSAPSITVTKDGTPVQIWYVELTYNGEVLADRVPIYLELAENCGATEPVGCAIDGTLLFSEDFGGNNTDDPVEGPPLDDSLISYSHQTTVTNGVDEGAYIITKKSRGNDVWYEVTDHTYPDDLTRGYMLQVNANKDAGQFYSLQIDNLLDKQTLYFSTWIMSVLNYHGENPTNMIFVLEDGNNNVVAKYYTGNIPDASPTWKQYGFGFTIPEGQKSLVLRIINNGIGSSGNDFVLDDIEVRLCVPEAEILKPIDSDTVICANHSVNLVGAYSDRDNIFGNDLVYRWEWSDTGDVSDPSGWSVVSGTGISGISGVSNTGTISSTLTIDEMLPEHEKYYRFIVATSENIEDYNKRSMSRVVHLAIDTCIIAKNDTVSTFVNTPIVVPVLSNDIIGACSDADISLSLSTEKVAQNGSVSLINNKIVYTPKVDWVGIDSLDYVLTDCSSTFKSTATVYITVSYRPDNIVEACIGSASPITSSFTVDDTETYQWQQSKDKITWVDVAGATTNACTPFDKKAGVTYYRMAVTYDTKTVYSESRTVRIKSCQLPVNHNISVMRYGN